MKTIALLAAAGSLAAAAAATPAAALDVAPPAPQAAALAGFGSGIEAPAGFERDPPPHARSWGRRDRGWGERWDDDRWDDDDDWRERRRWRDRDRWNDRRWNDRRWDDRRWEGRRLGRRDRIWRGRDGRFHCRRDDGTTGLVIGAGVGALLGREIDRGDVRCR
ncbi:hypothetical protein [Erythrobacter sp. HL-111]|uniref:hypothetical protein n=1 Tax=Erythrobacter sp. HL-111 TaxID=1798193 RepID=UPI0006DB91FB|nr:hypothetical protein [Erythrobacter sp. HL-111]KPP94975.1 MAG: putative outer membrane protein [Erythrobacteraceae bacterium HL-111]SDS13931.1 hypothetical protein SAMN04515621_1026 [Erythrobacter sp. HL-111]